MILYITLYYILFDIKLCYGILTGDCTQQPVDEAVQHKKVFLYSVRVCVHAYAHTHTHTRPPYSAGTPDVGVYLSIYTLLQKETGT